MARPTRRDEVVVILWRDIPAQVNGRSGRQRHQVMLDGKFQKAIGMAKRKARIVTAHDDVAQWRRVATPCEGDPAEEAEALAARLDAAYSAQRLGQLAVNGGFEQ